MEYDRLVTELIDCTESSARPVRLRKPPRGHSVQKETPGGPAPSSLQPHLSHLLCHFSQHPGDFYPNESSRSVDSLSLSVINACPASTTLLSSGQCLQNFSPGAVWGQQPVWNGSRPCVVGFSDLTFICHGFGGRLLEIRAKQLNIPPSHHPLLSTPFPEHHCSIIM